MPDIPKTYQYYPSVPLSDLSDLFSVGNNRLAANKICIISYLSKVLRINKDFPYTNRYSLFIENTTSVDSIQWSIKLYNKGELQNNPADLKTTGSDTNSLTVLFDYVFFNLTGDLLFDKMIIACKVIKGAETKDLSIEHILVKMLTVPEVIQNNVAFWSNQQFVTNPDITNYLLNCVNDYLTEPVLSWNRNNILGPNPVERENLLSIVTGILYYNILNTFPEDYFTVDFDSFQNKNIESHLNQTPITPTIGKFRNGLCKLPLHLISDMSDDLKLIPDFSNIDSNNKVYKIISSTLVMDMVADFETDDFDLLPLLIKESKDRFFTNAQKCIELYNLTLFPKSAIKLTAMFIRFIFECSKKNACKECFEKQNVWVTLGLNEIKDHELFLKNILTHYFFGPSNNITEFDSKALKCYKLIWSQQTNIILKNIPRIVTAYFAKKIVKESTEGKYCYFERIDDKAIRTGANELRLAAQPDFDSILGRQVYLIVETLNCRNKQLTCNLRSAATAGAVRSLTGNNADLNIVSGPVTWAGNPVFVNGTNLTTFVGQSEAFDNIPGNHAHYINVHDDHVNAKYNVDHIDKAVIKINLRPQARADFDTWATNLAGNTANLEILVSLNAPTQAYYGNNLTLALTPGQFLNGNDNYDNTARFRVINRLVYEIFHKDNEYNFLNMNGALRKKIGKIENNFTRDIADTDAINLPKRNVYFIYHDEIDNELLICECMMYRPRKRANGKNLPNITNPYNSNPANIPAGFTSSAAATVGGDAYWNYYYANGDIITRDNPAATGTDYGIVKYPLFSNNINDVVDIVRMPNNLNKSYVVAGNNKSIIFSFSNTQRRYANPGCFAAFIGVLAELNYNDVESTGMCFEDATSYPSISHPNGDSIDTSYLTTVIKKHAIIASFKLWGFTNVISGLADLNDGAHHHQGDHNTHLHSGDFTDVNVHIINQV